MAEHNNLDPNLELEWRFCKSSHVSKYNDKRREEIDILIENGYFPDEIKYTYKKEIAKNVWLVEVSQNNEPKGDLVIKTSKNGQNEDNFQKEIQASLDLDHDNIVRFFKELYTVRNFRNDVFYLVMENCSLGASMDVVKTKKNKKPSDNQQYPLTRIKTIKEIVKYQTFHKKERMPELEAFNIMAQISDALCYLHDKKIAHLDIKPQNILIQKYKPDENVIVAKLTDFGICTQPEHFNKNNKVNLTDGTKEIYPPQRTGYEAYCPFKDDVWCMGTTFYLMMRGNMLFERGVQEFLKDKRNVGSRQEDKRHKIVRAVKQKFKPFPHYARLCAYNPADRPTMDDVNKMFAENK